MGGFCTPRHRKKTNKHQITAFKKRQHRKSPCPPPSEHNVDPLISGFRDVPDTFRTMYIFFIQKMWEHKHTKHTSMYVQNKLQAKHLAKFIVYQTDQALLWLAASVST